MVYNLNIELTKKEQRPMSGNPVFISVLSPGGGGASQS